MRVMRPPPRGSCRSLGRALAQQEPALRHLLRLRSGSREGIRDCPSGCQAYPVAAALAEPPWSLMVVSLVEDSPAPGTQSLPRAQGLPEGAGTARWVPEPPRASSAQRPCPRPGPSQELQDERPSETARRGRTVHRPCGTARGRWPLYDAVHRPDRLPTGRMVLSSESPASLGGAEVTPPPTTRRGGPVWLDAWQPARGLSHSLPRASPQPPAPHLQSPSSQPRWRPL